jgi:hypothetical protein
VTLLLRAWELLTPEELGQVREAKAVLEDLYRQRHGEWSGAPIFWLRGLLWGGDSRLPPDLSPAIMKRLMLVRLTERTGYELDVTCVGCGLQLPRKSTAKAHPEPACGYFELCPHCGGGRFIWWPLSLDQTPYPWKTLAGYTGESPAREWSQASEAVVQRLAWLWPPGV